MIWCFPLFLIIKELNPDYKKMYYYIKERLLPLSFAEFNSALTGDELSLQQRFGWYLEYSSFPYVTRLRLLAKAGSIILLLVSLLEKVGGGCWHFKVVQVYYRYCVGQESEHVRILHAVESGSRSWGFAFLDSDYDVRFIYVRRPEDYLKLEPSRDVIEWELDETLDINGWDLQKALKQYHCSNSTLFEWANSPVVYRTTEEWRRIHEAAREYFSVKASTYHYYGTAKSNFLEFLQGDAVRYKKYFYVIRPVLACLWIRDRECPPLVLFTELMEAELGSGGLEEVRRAVDKLLEIKASAPESGTGERIEVLNHFIEEQLEACKMMLDTMKDDRKTDWGTLNRLFLEIVGIERAGGGER